MIKKRTSQKRRGALTVEVAICLPLLMLTLFAFYELSRANMIRHAVESAAYEGSRTGILPGATREKVEDSVGFVLASVGVKNFTVDVTPDTFTSDTPRIRVDVAIPFRSNITIPHFFIDDPTFRASTELTRETF